MYNMLAKNSESCVPDGQCKGRSNEFFFTCTTCLRKYTFYLLPSCGKFVILGGEILVVGDRSSGFKDKISHVNAWWRKLLSRCLLSCRPRFSSSAGWWCIILPQMQRRCYLHHSSLRKHAMLADESMRLVGQLQVLERKCLGNQRGFS